MDEVERIIEEIKRVAKLRFSIMLEPDDEEEEIPHSWLSIALHAEDPLFWE
jgi:hypothetical protein